MLTVGTILNGAFAMLRTRVAAVGIWALIYLFMTVAFLYAMRPFFADILAMHAQTAAGAPADPSVVLGGLGRVFGLEMLGLIVLLVLYTAALRAALRPDDRAFAYLRLGADELRVLGLGIVLFFAFGALYLGLAITAGIVGGILSVALGREAIFPVILLLMFAVFAVLVYCQVRVSLAFALTVLRGQIVLSEAWRLTRGRFWTLFGAYFVLALIVALLSLVVFAITSGPYLAAMSHVTDPVAMRAAQQAQLAKMLGPMSVTTLIGLMISAILGACWIAMGAGASAAATLALLHEEYGEVGAGYA